MQLCYLNSVATHKFPIHSPACLYGTAELNKLDEGIGIVTSLLLNINILQWREWCQTSLKHVSATTIACVAGVQRGRRWVKICEHGKERSVGSTLIFHSCTSHIHLSSTRARFTPSPTPLDTCHAGYHSGINSAAGLG